MQSAAPQSDVPTARAFDVADYFRVPLADLGSVAGPDMAGIYIPESEVGIAPVGVSGQFLEDAGVYHRQYASTAYFKLLISDALKRIRMPAASPVILDIGSGSGNSVFPCLELFPDCRIVATDLSPNLLKILLDHVNGAATSAGRVVPVCIDATHDHYAEQVFDFVLGAAILHHLIDPGAAIAAASRALKPGGYAVFFEPFENGNAILRIAYAEILARADTETDRGTRDASAAHPGWLQRLRGSTPPAKQNAAELPDDVREMLRGMVDSLTLRSGTDKSAPIFRQIDDKWLFTRSFIEQRARAAGFDEVQIYPIHDIQQPFSNQTAVNLSLAAGATRERMPAWAWEILDYYDRVFSLELKRDLFIEACIILKKG